MDARNTRGAQSEAPNQRRPNPRRPQSAQKTLDDASMSFGRACLWGLAFVRMGSSCQLVLPPRSEKSTRSASFPTNLLSELVVSELPISTALGVISDQFAAHDSSAIALILLSSVSPSSSLAISLVICFVGCRVYSRPALLDAKYVAHNIFDAAQIRSK